MSLHVVDHPLLQDIMTRLRDRKCILPGLGDFGDRLYGT
jgi:uracil phosphoribosyltransferase